MSAGQDGALYREYYGSHLPSRIVEQILRSRGTTRFEFQSKQVGVLNSDGSADTDTFFNTIGG